MFLNVIFKLVKFLIEFRLNPALTVVYLSTYFRSIISWSLKLEHLTPPCWLCHAYFKVSDILYYVSWSYCIFIPKRSILVVLLYWYFLVPFLATREVVTPFANDPIMLSTSTWLFRHLEHQNLSSNGWNNFLVPFLATREAVVPISNDPIILSTLIRLFRHLRHQNFSTGDDFIYSSRIIFFAQFLASREAVAPLANDLI